MIARFQLFFVAVFAMVSLCHLIWCDTAFSADQKPLKVGFLYTGSARDGGWNQAHDAGRQYVDSKMKGSVVTTSAENIPENAMCERVMEKMIAQGNKVIFATSYGFLEPALRVAKRHPDVKLMHCGRPVPPGNKNVGSFFTTDYYKCLYAAGVVAGKMTKTNKLGYIGGHPIPSLLWCMNAFALGVRSVNPKATVHVVWINSWEDPAMEAESTKGLLERNCDVLVSNLNTSMTVCKVADKAKKYSIGTNLAANATLVKDGWLTGQSWNWGPLYVKVIESIQNNTWKAGDLRYDLKEGYADLAPFGSAVPDPVKKQAQDVMNKLKDHKLEVFVAPVKDRDGKVRLAQGQKVDQNWLNSMDFFVTSIEGSLPKK